MNQTKVAVVTDTRLNFQYFLHSVDRVDHNNFHFVNSIDDIEGRKFSAVVRVGTYKHLTSHQKLYAACLARIAS